MKFVIVLLYFQKAQVRYISRSSLCFASSEFSCCFWSGFCIAGYEDESKISRHEAKSPTTEGIYLDVFKPLRPFPSFKNLNGATKGV